MLPDCYPVVLFRFSRSPDRRCAPAACRTGGRSGHGNRRTTAGPGLARRRRGSRIRQCWVRASYLAAVIETNAPGFGFYLPISPTLTFSAANSSAGLLSFEIFAAFPLHTPYLSP